MKHRQILCLLAAALLLLSLLAGCSKPDAPEDGTRSAAQTQTASHGESGSARPGEPPEGQPGGTPPEGGPGGTPPEGGPGGTPPEGGPGGTPPEGGPGGTPPEGGPGGTPPEGGPGGGPGGPGGPGGDTAVDYRGATVIDAPADESGLRCDSSSADESALLVRTDGAVTLSQLSVTKTGDSDGGDACSFYGLNAAVLAKDGARLSISGGSVRSDARGANALFCYGGNGGRNGAQGDGSTLTLRKLTVRTTGDGSGGVMTTGGGVTWAYDLDVETSGRSSAPIRTDRGGGTVYVDGGRYVSNGLGSPVIYSTAEIHAAKATLISNLSEGVCIEGVNSIELTDCDLTASNTKRNGNATFLDSIMIYQSMSGDADSGTSSFTMTGGSLTSKSGHVFHVTNTKAVITLSGVRITNEDAENILLSVCADGWSGGGNAATLNAVGQRLKGAVKVGSDSSLSLNLSEGSGFEGSIDGLITDASGKQVSAEAGSVTVTLDASSTWSLTADSYVSAFHGDAANIRSNGHTLYVNGAPLGGTK